MALLNPIYHYTLLIPFLITSALPALVLAVITTSCAIFFLFLRTLLLCIDLILAVVPYYLSRPKLKPAPQRPSLNTARFSFGSNTSRRRTGSSISSESLTPSADLSLNLGLSASRDYEGVGGWQLSNAPDENDMLWTSINSRLELPSDHGRRQIRGSVTSKSEANSLLGHLSTSPDM